MRALMDEATARFSHASRRFLQACRRLRSPVWSGLLGLTLGASVAEASVISASDAYQAGRFAEARENYAVMARFGHRTSQYNLATMLLKGEGGASTPAEAFAWVSLAAEGGYPPAIGLLRQMEPLADETDRRTAQELRQRFGVDAIVARLMAEQERAIDAVSMSSWVEKPSVRRPPTAPRRHPGGWAVVELLRNADGKVRDPRVLFEVNSDPFAGALMEAALEARAAPVESDEPFYVILRFQIPMAGHTAYRFDSREIRSLCEAARSGDPRAMTLCGSALWFEQRPNVWDPIEGRRMLARAALAGQPDAAHLMGSLLTASPDPEIRREAGLWWEIAAVNGHLPAALRVAQRWLREESLGADHVRRIREWLGAGASSEETWVMKHVAAILAATPHDQLRDPAAAAPLLPRLKARQGFDPEVLEIEAATYANQGMFERAEAAQLEALAAAEKLGWDLQHLEMRLARYRAGEGWTGSWW